MVIEITDHETVSSESFTNPFRRIFLYFCNRRVTDLWSIVLILVVLLLYIEIPGNIRATKTYLKVFKKNMD